jgi:hypothetical protein
MSDPPNAAIFAPTLSPIGVLELASDAGFLHIEQVEAAGASDPLSSIVWEGAPKDRIRIVIELCRMGVANPPHFVHNRIVHDSASKCALQLTF